MKYEIMSISEFSGYRFNNSGDLALVFEGPYSNAMAPDPLKPATWDNIASWGVSDRIASIHVVCPFYTEKVGGYSLRQLRAGWSRVRKELSFVPSVKRILLLGSKSSMFNTVLGFKLEKGLRNTHGTIFTLADGLEIVPTWQKAYPHMRSWKNRDIERWAHLSKAEPLPYYESLDKLTGDKIVVDLETTGFEQHDTITVLGVQWSDTERALIYGEEEIQQSISLLCQHVLNGAHTYFHNGQFDLIYMGQEFRDAVTEHDAMHCTMIRAKARGELVNSLKHLGIIYTDRPGNYAYTLQGEQHSFTDPRYVCEDLETTWQLSKVYETDGQKPVVQQFERCIVMAAEQSLSGSYINQELLEQLYEQGKINVEYWREICLAEFGVDPGKDRQLEKVLLEQGYLLKTKTKSGKYYKLDDKVLDELGLDSVLQYRHAVKLDSTFIGKIRKSMRADSTVKHTQTMLGADTGRTTMKDFNWQQAAKKGPVRNLVCSRFAGGKILVVDLAQAELRVLAYVSGDLEFAGLFEKEDPHLSNASRAFDVPEHEVTEELRFDAKAVIFKVVYGGKAVTPGQRRVEKFYRSAFRDAFYWIDAIAILAKRNLEVTDNYGKTRNLQEVAVWRGLSGVARAGINSPIQGIASHIAMQVTYNAWRLFKKHKMLSKIIFGVHDSVMADIHPDEIVKAQLLFRLAFAQLRDSHMFKAFPLAKVLPMQGELLIGNSWGEIDSTKKAIIKAGEHVMCSSLDTITLEECLSYKKKGTLLDSYDYF